MAKNNYKLVFAFICRLSAVRLLINPAAPAHAYIAQRPRLSLLCPYPGCDNQSKSPVSTTRKQQRAGNKLNSIVCNSSNNKGSATPQLHSDHASICKRQFGPTKLSKCFKRVAELIKNKLKLLKRYACNYKR